MRRKCMMFIMLFTGCLFIANNSFAAWTQGKGHSYNQLTFSHYQTVKKRTTLVKDEDGTIVGLYGKVRSEDSAEFTSTKISYYGEYGITNQFTGIISGGWDWIRSDEIQDATYGEEDGPSGVGDIIVGFRQKISDNLGGGYLASLQGEVKIPEAYDYEHPAYYQNLGDGQYDAMLKLVFGKGFSWGYAVFFTGYKYRFENDQLDKDQTFKPGDQLTFSLSGGYNVAKWVSIRAKLEYTESMDNAEISDELIAGFQEAGGESQNRDVAIIKDSLALESDVLSMGLALAFNVADKTQLVVSYDRDLVGDGVFQTKDAALGQTYSLALARSF